jgi:hypothetical protein
VNSERELWELMERANDVGVRLEIIGGLYRWEPFPGVRHQIARDQIQKSIVLKSGCMQIADVSIRFADGSITRPDLAIFPRRPDEEDEAVTLVPEAVIEIISKGSEAKDVEIAPYFYLAQGVKDVVIFDPYTLFVLHARRDGRKHFTSPVTIQFECGCQCGV